MQTNTLLQSGIYTVSEAAALTEVPRRRISRWLSGYVYRSGAETRFSSPVWSPSLPKVDHALALSFADLMEVRFINAFREAGVSWKKIRKAAEVAREEFGLDHPFSAQAFLTDGRSIFARVANDPRAEPALLDLVKSQFAFERVIKPSLYAGFEFDGSGGVSRWWPLGKAKPVVLDPQRAFGQPIDPVSGTPTNVLAQAVKAEGSVQAAAKWYQVSLKTVRAAVTYEQRLAA